MPTHGEPNGRKGRIAGAGDGGRPGRAIAAPLRAGKQRPGGGKGHDSCLVFREKLSDGLAAALPDNAGGPVNLALVAFVCAMDLASRDMGIVSSVLMLSRPGRKKKTEGLQYQRVPNEPRKGRVSGLKKAVFRVSCLVFRENLGIRAGLRRAPG